MLKIITAVVMAIDERVQKSKIIWWTQEVESSSLEGLEDAWCMLVAPIILCTRCSSIYELTLRMTTSRGRIYGGMWWRELQFDCSGGLPWRSLSARRDHEETKIKRIERRAWHQCKQQVKESSPLKRHWWSLQQCRASGWGCERMKLDVNWWAFRAAPLPCY